MCCLVLLCCGAWSSLCLGAGLDLGLEVGLAVLVVVLGVEGIFDWVSPFTWSSSATERKELSSS